MRPGETFGLLGPNGGGKSTLLSILATLFRPTAGTARVAGLDVVAERRGVRRKIGVVFQSPGLDPWLTGRENLRHHGHLYGMRGGALAARIDASLAALGVSDRADERTRTLSGGLRRRVELAKGLLPGPEVLLLDEPSAGLDPGARADLWRHLRSLADGGVTVVAATHSIEEAERCDRIAILDKGALVAEGAPDALRRGIAGDVVTVQTADPEALAAAIRARLGAEAAAVDGAVRLELPDGPAFVARLAAEFPDAVRSITVGKPTLEDVFLQRTGHRFAVAPSAAPRPGAH